MIEAKMLPQNFGNKIVLGSRVAVPIAGDFYAAATVQAVRNDMKGNEYVTVKFDDNNKGECRSSEIVGAGFKSIQDIRLHKDQRVYATRDGVEIMGIVEDHSDGMVRVNLMNSNECIRMREEDIRLTESRHSQRINENPDYRRIASINASPSHGKKRPVSANIEVPHACRARKSSTEPTMDDLMAAMVLSSLSSSPVFHNPRSPTTRKADSPLSVASSGVGSWQDTHISPLPGEPAAKCSAREEDLRSPERSSVILHTHQVGHSPSSSTDHIEIDVQDPANASERMEDDSAERQSPSGVAPPGHSTPAPFHTGNQYHPVQKQPLHSSPYHLKSAVKLEAVKEEPGDKGKSVGQPVENMFSVPRQIVYVTPSFVPGVNPEYMVHFQSLAGQQLVASAQDPSGVAFAHPTVMTGPRPSSANVYHHGSPTSTFYTVPVMNGAQLNPKLVYAQPRLASRNDRPDTAVPPFRGPESRPVRVPVVMKPQAQPINIPGAKAFSWHATGRPQSQYSPKPSVLAQRQHMHQAASPKMSFPMSPKNLPSGRKVRGDGKKCRKVYGMENRDLWCTSCRWKKACQRFPD